MTKIYKGLSPEQNIAVESLKALLEQIEALGTADADDASNMEDKMAEDKNKTDLKDEGKKEPEDISPEKEIKKDTSEQKDKATTAGSGSDQKAEEKIDDIPEPDKKNLAEVAKQLAMLNAKFDKQAETEKKVASLSAQVEELTKSISNMLEDVGIAKALESHVTTDVVQKEAAPQPIVNADAAAIFKTMLKEVVAEMKTGEAPISQAEAVRKSLKDTLFNQ